MKLPINQLEQHLSKQLASLYVISSDEILLAQEALDTIRVFARKAGFIEKVKLTVEPHVDWSKRLVSECNSLTLFSSKKMVELYLGSAKPNAAANKILKDLVANLGSDTLLVIIANKFDSKTEQTTWFKALDQNGVVMTIWPISMEQLPQWILQRAKKRNLNLTPDAAKFLAEQMEGNLLAAAQEIEKLSLLQTNEVIDVSTISKVVTDNARFDIFNLVECALSGKQERCIRMLKNLEEEDAEPPIILWAFARELRMLAEMSLQISKGVNLSSLFGKYRIWEKRQPAIRRFLQHHNAANCRELLSSCLEIDRLIKGAKSGNIWIALQQLTLKISLPIESKLPRVVS